MNIQLTAKKIEIPQEIREYALEKFSRLEKYNSKLSSIEVVIKAEERTIVCELVARVDNREPVVIETQGETIQAAIDLAENKAERHLRKDKERESQRRRARPDNREMP